MKIPSLARKTTFLIILSWANTSFGGIGCPDLLSWLGGIPSFRLAREVRNFDFEVFKAAKNNYIDFIHSNSLPKDKSPKTLEEKMALVEVLANMKETNFNIDFNRKVLGKGFKNINFEKGLSPFQIEELIEDLFLASHANPETIRGLIKSGWSKAIRTIILDRVLGEIATKGINDTIISLGLNRNHSFKETLFRKFKDNRGKLEAFLTTILNLPSLLGAPPIHLPKIKLAGRKAIPPNLIKKILTQGFDSAYPDIYRIYGKRANFDLTWSWMRKAYSLGLCTFIAGQAYQIIHDEEKKKEKAGKRVKGCNRKNGRWIYDTKSRSSTFIRSMERGLSRPEWERARLI